MLGTYIRTCILNKLVLQLYIGWIGQHLVCCCLLEMLKRILKLTFAFQFIAKFSSQYFPV